MSSLKVELRHRLATLNIDARFDNDGGGITAIYGRSGAGKTTLINMIAGLVQPESGRVVLGDDVLFDEAQKVNLAPEHRRIGYVFQQDRLFPHLDVRANLEYGAPRRRGGDQAIRFDDVVDMLGIGALLARRTHHLSGGERQRIAIGRALLSGPELLLMDEPLANLDVARRAEILPYIEQLRDSLGLPIIYVSHATEEVIRLADTVVLMSDGKTVASGPVEEVMSRLDLRPLTGRYEAGAVLPVSVAGHDAADGLSRLDFAGGTMIVPAVELPPGQTLRIRVRARDVALALDAPSGISILNVFAGRVLEIEEAGTAQMDVLLDIAVPQTDDASDTPCRLWARITKRSARELALAPGTPVHAMIKAVAIDRHSLGQ